jgi:ABC-type Mn2+/Zn2+ transport system permease subunit
MIATACAIGVFAGVAGLYLSYFAGIAAGAAIAGLLVAIATVAASVQVISRARTTRSVETSPRR